MDVCTDTLQDNMCINVNNPQIINKSNINFTQNVSGGNIVVINNYYKKEQTKSKLEELQLQTKKKDHSIAKPNNEHNQTISKSKDPTIRYDKVGNKIIKGGNHKVTFIDKVTKNKLVNITDIESFKHENIIEEKTVCQSNMSCCFII